MRLRIDNLFNFEKGTLQSSKCTPGKYNFITAASDWKTHNSYTHDCEAIIFAAAASGSLGRAHYVNGKFTASDLCFILAPKDSINYPVDMKFYFYVFNLYKNDIVNKTKSGTSKESINLSSFGKYELPYVSYEKQKQISKKISEANELISSLNYELDNQSTFLLKLKQSILSDAIRGNLVPQNPNDEPASELLKRIKAEKRKLIKEGNLKKEKELPPIKTEEIPFDIPKNWVWCRLGDLIMHTPNLNIENKLNPDVVINYVDIDSIDNTNYEIREIKERKVRDLSTRARRVLKKGFILYSLVRPYLNNIAIVKASKKNFIASTGFAVFRCILTHNEYIKYLLLSNYIRNYYLSLLSGFNSPSITVEDFINTPVPVPPLKEQKVLVDKIKKTVELLNKVFQIIDLKESMVFCFVHKLFLEFME